MIDTGINSSDDAKIGGNHARHIDLHRQERLVATEHLVAVLALRVLHHDLADRALDENDKGDHGDSHDEHGDDQDCRQGARPAEFKRAGQSRRHFGDNAREDDQRDTVTDTAAGDLFAKPHQEQRTANQRCHGCDPEKQPGISDHAGRRLKADGNAIALNRCQKHGQIAGILVDLLATGLTVLFQLFQRRDDGGHQLHDDRCRDVRHDVQREDRHPAEGTAREHVEHAENAGRLLREDVGQRPRINARKRQVGAKTVDDQRANSEPQALLQLLGLGECAETGAGCHAFCGGCHTCALPC